MPLLACYRVSRSPWFLFVNPWADSGIAQGRVLSPLLLNLLVNGLIAAVRRVAPGVQLFSSSARSPGQLYADDLELMVESQLDLQVALDAVAFHFWYWTEEVRCNGVWLPTPCSSVFRHACRSFCRWFSSIRILASF